MTHSDTDPAVNPEPRLPVNSPGLTAGGFSPVAALFVEAGGSYCGLDGVDPWDETRDARKYRGPHPVVAHPPCQRWGKFWAGQPLWIARTGERKVKGDDGGCFEHALWCVRTFGGVLEHPWGSHAWAHFGLNLPDRDGKWINADFLGGWTCCVEQGEYGHYARKPTLLLAYGVELPSLRWAERGWTPGENLVERMGIKKARRMGELATRGGGKDNHHRIGTPPEFRDLILGIARSVPQ